MKQYAESEEKGTVGKVSLLHSHGLNWMVVNKLKDATLIQDYLGDSCFLLSYFFNSTIIKRDPLIWHIFADICKAFFP